MQYLDSTLLGTDEDWNLIVTCIIDLASALSEIHSHNIVHRYDRVIRGLARILK
jgi:hypothetical protein